MSLESGAGRVLRVSRVSRVRNVGKVSWLTRASRRELELEQEPGDARETTQRFASLTAEEAARLHELRPVKYAFISDPGRPRMGFIAQELREVLPGLVTECTRGQRKGMLTVAYHDLLALVVRELQGRRMSDAQHAALLALADERLARGPQSEPAP